MKWIKLFESFQSDALEDAKDILRLHLGEIEEIDILGGEFDVSMSDAIKDRIRVYRLLESPNVRDLAGFEKHMREEAEGIFWNVNLDWYRGKVAILCEGESIESLLGEWLRERFSGLSKYGRDKRSSLNQTSPIRQVLWIDSNGSSVFYYGDHEKTAYFSYEKIWGFFRNILCLEDSQIREILHDWILKEYGLDLEPKPW